MLPIIYLHFSFVIDGCLPPSLVKRLYVLFLFQRFKDSLVESLNLIYP